VAKKTSLPPPKKTTEIEVKHQIPIIPKESYVPADLFDRTIAYIIDCVLVAIPIGFIFTMIDGANTSFLSATFQPIQMVISSLLFFLYFFFAIGLNSGQSLGQLIMKLRVITGANFEEALANKETVKISLKQGFLHAIGKIPYLIWLDLLVGILLHKNSSNTQRLTQYYANTTVIKKETPLPKKK
jgi:uncharacterized RDD family membrane protein YckC